MTVQQVHTTDRSLFKTCRQKWEFGSNLRMNLEPVTPVTALWFGTGIHEALAAYYSGDDPYKVWFDYCNTGGDHEGKYSEEDHKRFGLGIAMLNQYTHYAKENDTFEPVWVEKHYEIPIPGIMTDAIYSFKCDGLVKDRHGRYWILEHKTTGTIPDNTDYLLLDDQVGSYIWALQEAEGIEIEGVIYNWLRKKAPQPLRELKNGAYSIALNQDTTYAIALETLTKADLEDDDRYTDFLEALKNKPNGFVKRERVRRNKQEIERVGQSITMEGREMLNDPAIYRTPSRYNCNYCPFKVPCLLKWGGDDYKTVLDSEFKVRT